MTSGQDNTMTDILTIDEVAKYLRVSGRTVYDWAQKGQIPAGKIGNVWRFKKSELEDWVNDRLSSGTISHKEKKASINEKDKKRGDSANSTGSIDDFLSPKRIIFFDEKDKDSCMKELGNLLSRSKEVGNPVELMEEIEKREALMSTAIGKGIAIPHVRLSSVSNLVVAIGISREGIKDYIGLDGEPVHTMIMIAAALEQHEYYLRVISYFSAKLALDGLEEKLINAKSEKEVFSILK